jgi:hypothetical protein
MVSIKWAQGAGEPASSAGPRQAIETTPIVPATSSRYAVIENDAEAGRFVKIAHSGSSPLTVAQGRPSSLKT